MKFKHTKYGKTTTYESKEEYFNSGIYRNRSYEDGQIEAMERKIEYLESVIGRWLNHTKLNLEQLSDIVDGYDRELEEVEE